MRTRTLLTLAWILLLGFSAFGQEEKPRGTVMNLAHELKLGQLSVTVEGKQSFLPPASFRLVGSVSYPQLGIEGAMVAVSDGKVVKQYVETAVAVNATTMDLEKLGEGFSGYEPADDYDPMVYKNVLDEIPEKKSLPPVEMDGAAVEGYEFPAPAGGAMLIPESLRILPLPTAVKYRVWVNPQDGVLRKMEAEDAAGQVFLTMTYTNVKTGVDLPAGTFQYEFPDGVTPNDMTDAILRQASQPAVPVPASEKE